MSVRTLNWEVEKPVSLARDATIVILCSILMGLLGQLAIPLPFLPVPVPVVAQLQAILLMAVLLGSRRAAAAVFAFLLQGAMGLPVFAEGKGGFIWLFSSTGGYLFGYLAAAFIVGAIVERSRERSLAKACLAMIVGNGVVYFFGAGYLATLIGVQKALLFGIVPFLLGDAIKIAFCVKILRWIGWDRR